jgi:hypothetical protein
MFGIGYMPRAKSGPDEFTIWININYLHDYDRVLYLLRSYGIKPEDVHDTTNINFKLFVPKPPNMRMIERLNEFDAVDRTEPPSPPPKCAEDVGDDCTDDDDVW